VSAVSELKVQAVTQRIIGGELSGKFSHNKVRPRLSDGSVVYKDDVPNSNTKQGAVLAVFFKENEGGDYRLVFTKRKANLKAHSGQISFPGGRLENDESAVDAAVRECHEEIGIAIDVSQVVGPLSKIYISESDFEVVPFVSFLNQAPKFSINDDEVAEIFDVPLRHLLDSKNLKSEIRLIRDKQVDVPFYLWKSHKIWGATAAILTEILDVIQENI